MREESVLLSSSEVSPAVTDFCLFEILTKNAVPKVVTTALDDFFFFFSTAFHLLKNNLAIITQNAATEPAVRRLVKANAETQTTTKLPEVSRVSLSWLTA